MTNHRKAVTHENSSKSSISMICMTNPRINARMPLSLQWQYDQSAHAYENEGFLKNKVWYWKGTLTRLNGKCPRKVTYCSKDETYPEFNKGNIQWGWICPPTYNAQLSTLSKDVIAKATHNKEYHIGFHCKHMGADATLFKSCPAIVTIGFHSANFK